MAVGCLPSPHSYPILCNEHSLTWQRFPIDISATNVSFGVLPEAFTDEALSKTFEYDKKSSVVLRGVPDLGMAPPRPANLPKYVISRFGGPLKTDAQNMSLVDIIDFGKGLSPSIPIEFSTGYHLPSFRFSDALYLHFLDKGFQTPSKTKVFGTKNYRAPELDRDGKNTATAKSDLWSLGCVVGCSIVLDTIRYNLGEFPSPF